MVLVGGDGTLHAAANAPLRELPELALVPAGRANNVARALGIPTSRVGALSVAVQSPARPLDALRVATPDRFLYAIEAVSAGFQAEARAAYDSDNSADLRQGLRALVRAVRRYSPYRARVELDSGTFHSGDAAQLFFSNLPFFGFGFHVDPGADPADGRFEAIVLEARSRRRLLRLLAAARRGRHLGRSGVRRVPATRARLTEALPLVADAVPLGTTTATVSSRGRAAARGLPGSGAGGMSPAASRLGAPGAAGRLLAGGGGSRRGARPHDDLPAGAARADRGLPVADRRGHDGQRDRRLRRADRDRHLVATAAAAASPLSRAGPC